MTAPVVSIEVDDFAQIVAKLLVMRETMDETLTLLEQVSGRKFRDIARCEQSLTGEE